MQVVKTSNNAEETTSLGKQLGQILCGGDVVCLTGDLGAGKTAFAQGVGAALSITDYITSPTFTMIQEYSSEQDGHFVKFIHMDLYRLRSIEEAEVIGVSDYFQPDTICLIEWPEVISAILPDDRLDIVIEGSGLEVRCLLIKPFGEEWEERLGTGF
ncbi:MAG: tRNA (adenosine(37)-N6)-threonylcarbamoyltransferase complex ATPase subunit type 1 TsaE [Desulfitobacterium hafniense]|nr:tRNA (adenosine(37)-N6)-threonylcarbamoyltransferase complex ATPase subunit type 1 TsaE [Desulfitobacterium hafniense]